MMIVSPKQLGFLVSPSTVSQNRQQHHPAEINASAAATSTASLSEMLRASWTPARLPTFGRNASKFSTETLRAPMAGGEAGPGQECHDRYFKSAACL